MYRQFYFDHLKKYKRLIRQWTIWAVTNTIPLYAPQHCPNGDFAGFNLADVPYGRMYFTMAQIQSLSGDIWQNFDIVNDVLCPQSASDTEEVVLWIRDLLQSIYAEVC